MSEFKDDRILKFEETNGRVRAFCEQYYMKDLDGNLRRNGQTVSPTTLINDMLSKRKLSEDELLAMLG